MLAAVGVSMEYSGAEVDEINTLEALSLQQGLAYLQRLAGGQDARLALEFLGPQWLTLERLGGLDRLVREDARRPWSDAD